MSRIVSVLLQLAPFATGLPALDHEEFAHHV